MTNLCCSNRNRSEILTDKETGLEGHLDSMADQSSADSCVGQDAMVIPHHLQDVDGTQHTLSQNTSVGVASSDEIEEFEDDSSW